MIWHVIDDEMANVHFIKEMQQNHLISVTIREFASKSPRRGYWQGIFNKKKKPKKNSNMVLFSGWWRGPSERIMDVRITREITSWCGASGAEIQIVTIGRRWRRYVKLDGHTGRQGEKKTGGLGGIVSGLRNFLDFWLICLICDHRNPLPFHRFQTSSLK